MEWILFEKNWNIARKNSMEKQSQPTFPVSVFDHRNIQKILLILFIGLFLYSLMGCFPVSMIEADGVGIANGIQVMQRNGLGENPFTYFVASQPGSYLLVYFCSSLVHAQPYLVFSVLSGIALVIFICACSLFLARITKLPFALAGIVLLLIQETTASGYYANSTIIACTLTLIGIQLLYFRQSIASAVFSGLLIGFGVSCRLEVGLLIIPFVIAMLYKEKKISMRLFISGMVALLMLVLVFISLHLTTDSILRVYHIHKSLKYSNDVIQGLPLLGYKDMRSFISFMSVGFYILVFTGVAHLIHVKNYKMLLFSLLGIVPFMTIFWGQITTPKYLYTILPFVAILLLYGIQVLILSKKAKLFSGMVLLLFLGQYIFGVQLDLKSKPYREEIIPVLVKLLSIPNLTDSVTELSIVLGSGSSISTDDGYRLTTGLAYAPIFWHAEKAHRILTLRIFMPIWQRNQKARIHCVRIMMPARLRKMYCSLKVIRLM